MSVQDHCPQCKEPLPGTFLGGLCPKCLAKTISAGLLPETKIRRFGDYELLEEIGRGGMGVVYKARQVSLDRTVAVKMILGANLASEADVQRFHTEAEAAARLDHPNIVAIHEVGTYDGQPYFSMQWIRGRSLAARVSNQAFPIGSRQAAEVLKKVSRAVHHAHQRGILHRDLKPGNILMDEEDQPYVSDFGLARKMTAESHATIAGAVLGSPSFMAPEQAVGKGEPLTTSADIYSLGAVLYFLLVRRPPFAQATPLETLHSVVEEEPARPSSIDPAVDRDLETICRKCLEKDPQRRYASADALADDLERWLRQEPILARPASTAEQVVKWAKRKPVVASLIGAMILIAATGFAAVVWQWRQTENARRMTVRAERDAVEKLYASYLAQARANRWSGQPGRRFDTLKVVSKAAAIRPSLDLRNEAIACLALPDAQVQRRLSPASGLLMGGLAFDARFERYARAFRDGSIAIGQVANDRELVKLAGPGKPTAAALYFSPNGRYLAERYAGPETNQVRVWDLARRQALLAEVIPAGVLSFSPDSQQLAVPEENGRIHFYDLSLGREVSGLDVPPLPRAVSYDPLGKRLAISRAQNPAVLIVNLASRQTEQSFEHPGGIGLVAWSPDGTLLACPCENGHVYLRRVGAGNVEAVLEGHIGVATAAAFNGGGDMLVTSGWDGMSRFWDPKLGRPMFSIPGGWVPIAFGPDDRRLGFDLGEQEAGILQVEPARECRRLGRAGVLWGGQFSPDGRLLAAGSSDGVRIWRVQANQLLRHLQVNECRSVLFSADGRSLIASGGAGLHEWPLRYTEQTGELNVGPAKSLSSSSFEGACLGPDGRTLLVACHGMADVIRFDLEAPGSSKPMLGHPMAVSVSSSTDGKWFATGTWKGTNVKVWDTTTGQPIKELAVRGNATVRFSPDGKWLVTGSEEEYRFWKAGCWEPGLSVLRDRSGDMYGTMAFSADGLLLALLRGRNSEVRLISVPDGRGLATLETGPPLCFSRDGSQLATAGEDLRSVFVWDLRLIRQQLAALKLDW